MSVDLPAPLAPTSPCTSPRAISRSASPRASSPPKDLRQTADLRAPFGGPAGSRSPVGGGVESVSDREHYLVGWSFMNWSTLSALTTTPGMLIIFGVHEAPAADGVQDRLEDLLAFLVGRLPDGSGHVAVLDLLDRLRAAVDRDGDDVGASGLPEGGGGAGHRLVPARPDAELAVAACGMAGQPRLRQGHCRSAPGRAR